MSENAENTVTSQNTDETRAIGRNRIPGYFWSIPVILVFGVIAFLTWKVLVPTAADPESKLYLSSLGYPAHQRRTGQPIEVAVTRVSDTPVTNHIAASGETVGLVDVDVRSQFTGVVDSVLVEEGARVKKGDVLLKLISDPAQDALTRAKAALAITEISIEYNPKVHQERRVELEATVEKCSKLLEIAEARLKRYKSLGKANAVSPEELADIEELQATRVWELATAKQQLAQHLMTSEQDTKHLSNELTQRKVSVSEAERDLANTTITAPADGLVTRLLVQPGELAVQELSAVSLADKVVFKAYIDQTGIDAVRPGDSAIVRLVARPGETFQGTVIRINPSIDVHGTPAERGRVDTRFTYSAWIDVMNKDLPPGLQGNVEFRSEQSQATLPDSAVIHLSGGEGMVMTVRDGKAAMAKVQTGPARDGLREIKSGLLADDQVVLHPLGIEAGDLLRPVAMGVQSTSFGAERILTLHQPNSNTSTRE
jgi:HlyD family secretion protein